MFKFVAQWFYCRPFFVLP